MNAIEDMFDEDEDEALEQLNLPPCGVCRGTEWTRTSLGSLVCGLCGTQNTQVSLTAQSEVGESQTLKLSGRYVSRTPSRAANTPGAMGSQRVQKRKHAVREFSLTLFLAAYQAVLSAQVRVLTTAPAADCHPDAEPWAAQPPAGCPPKHLWSAVGSVWRQLLAKWRRSGTPIVRVVNGRVVSATAPSFEQQVVHAKERSGSADGGASGEDGAGGGDGGNGASATSPGKGKRVVVQRTKGQGVEPACPLSMDLTLAMVVWGLRRVRSGVLASDLVRWAASGRLPFLNVAAAGEDVLPEHVQAGVGVAQAFFSPRAVPSPERVEWLAEVLAADLHMPLSPLNAPAVAARLCCVLKAPPATLSVFNVLDAGLRAAHASQRDLPNPVPRLHASPSGTCPRPRKQVRPPGPKSHPDSGPRVAALVLLAARCCPGWRRFSPTWTPAARAGGGSGAPASAPRCTAPCCPSALGVAGRADAEAIAVPWRRWYSAAAAKAALAGGGSTAAIGVGPHGRGGVAPDPAWFPWSAEELCHLPRCAVPALASFCRRIAFGPPPSESRDTTTYVEHLDAVAKGPSASLKRARQDEVTPRRALPNTPPSWLRNPFPNRRRASTATSIASDSDSDSFSDGSGSDIEDTVQLLFPDPDVEPGDNSNVRGNGSGSGSGNGSSNDFRSDSGSGSGGGSGSGAADAGEGSASGTGHDAQDNEAEDRDRVEYGVWVVQRRNGATSEDAWDPAWLRMLWFTAPMIGIDAQLLAKHVADLELLLLGHLATPAFVELPPALRRRIRRRFRAGPGALPPIPPPPHRARRVVDPRVPRKRRRTAAHATAPPRAGTDDRVSEAPQPVAARVGGGDGGGSDYLMKSALGLE